MLSGVTICRLGELKRGQKAVILKVGSRKDSIFSIDLTQRLLEMGFIEGSIVELFHQDIRWFRASNVSIVVRVRGSLFALRTNEANTIEVQVL